jgi:hypothetical protein
MADAVATYNAENLKICLSNMMLHEARREEEAKVERLE